MQILLLFFSDKQQPVLFWMDGSTEHPSLQCKSLSTHEVFLPHISVIHLADI